MPEYPFMVYDIALTLLPKVGGVRARQLLALFGNSKAMFEAGKSELSQIRLPGAVVDLYELIQSEEVLEKAREELEYIRSNDFYVASFFDDSYPRRLKQCVDAPLVIYGKGILNLDAKHVIAIVGTRKATEYGIHFCEDLVAQMGTDSDFLVISGLAYGIDVAAHRACLKCEIPTVGILAHGLDHLYPSRHRTVADKMCGSGGILTDFPRRSEILPVNFVKRNRIIAGLADATVVIESGKKGGALLTADMAISYNRDVFALPGKIDMPYSAGCNGLIKQNKACLIESIRDIEYQMNWSHSKYQQPKVVQRSLFVDLTEDERRIVSFLEGGPRMIDEISTALSLPGSRVSALLLDIEFKGVISSLPGKMYRLI